MCTDWDETISRLFVHIVALLLVPSQSLASPEPGIPAVPLLLLLHARYICVGYATTILVRHWAVLYQQMGKNQQTEGQLTEGIAREFFLSSYFVVHTFRVVSSDICTFIPDDFRLCLLYCPESCGFL